MYQMRRNRVGLGVASFAALAAGVLLLMLAVSLEGQAVDDSMHGVHLPVRAWQRGVVS